jgi:hypothetical protein
MRNVPIFRQEIEMSEIKTDQREVIEETMTHVTPKKEYTDRERLKMARKRYQSMLRQALGTLVRIRDNINQGTKTQDLIYDIEDTLYDIWNSLTCSEEEALRIFLDSHLGE